MTHEENLTITHGPSLEMLTASLRWYAGRPRGAQAIRQVPPLSVRFTATDMFECFVIGLRWLPELHPNQVWIEVADSKAPDALRWSGIYNFRTHRGQLALGFEADTLLTSVFGESGIVQMYWLERTEGPIATVSDLVACTELEVCESMRNWLDWGAGGRPGQNIETAVTSFGILRAALKVEGFRFLGKRHELLEIEEHLSSLYPVD